MNPLLTPNEKKILEAKQLENINKNYNELLEKSINYNKSIISIGYVSFFAILLSIKNYINNDTLYKIAICTVISLSFYIAWIVLEMIINSVTLIKSLWLKLSTRWKRFYLILWPIVLCLTILPIIYAVYLLIQALFHCIQTS